MKRILTGPSHRIARRGRRRGLCRSRQSSSKDDKYVIKEIGEPEKLYPPFTDPLHRCD